MSTLLGIFKNLHSLCIAGMFRSQCLIDKHLLCISDHIHICHEMEIDPLLRRIRGKQEESQPQNGISSLLCYQWIKNPAKRVIFDNIITRIKLNAVWSLLTTTSTKDIDSTSSSKDRLFKFGTVEVEPNFLAELSKLQQRKGFQWTVKEDLGRKNKYTINSANSSVSVEFDVILPYTKPDFSNLLNKLAAIKNYVETTESFSYADQSDIQKQISAIELHLYEYEQYYKLIDAQIDLVQMQHRQQQERRGVGNLLGIIGNMQGIVRRIEHDGERDLFVGVIQDINNILHGAADLNQADEFRRTTFQDINRMEQIIQLRIRQPLPVSTTLSLFFLIIFLLNFLIHNIP